MAEELKNIIRNCKEATLISLKKEQGKITIKERIKLSIHLLYCDACKQFIKQSAIINKAMKQIHQKLHQHPTHTLSAEAKEKLQRQLDNLH